MRYRGDEREESSNARRERRERYLTEIGGRQREKMREKGNLAHNLRRVEKEANLFLSLPCPTKLRNYIPKMSVYESSPKNVQWRPKCLSGVLFPLC